MPVRPEALFKMITKWPLRGTVGLILVAVFWTLNWSLPGLRAHWGFSRVGLLMLTRILFGRFRGNHFYRRWRVKQRWKQMNPEEREKFRKTWGHSCDDCTGAGAVNGVKSILNAC